MSKSKTKYVPLPSKPEQILHYLRYVGWDTAARISEKTNIRGRSLGGSLRHLCTAKKVLRVVSRDNEHIFVYVPISKRKLIGGAA